MTWLHTRSALQFYCTCCTNVNWLSFLTAFSSFVYVCRVMMSFCSEIRLVAFWNKRHVRAPTSPDALILKVYLHIAYIYTQPLIFANWRFQGCWFIKHHVAYCNVRITAFRTKGNVKKILPNQKSYVFSDGFSQTIHVVISSNKSSYTVC